MPPPVEERENTNKVTNSAQAKDSIVKVFSFRRNKQKKNTFLRGGDLKVKLYHRSSIKFSTTLIILDFASRTLYKNAERDENKSVSFSWLYS